MIEKDVTQMFQLGNSPSVTWVHDAYLIADSGGNFISGTKAQLSLDLHKNRDYKYKGFIHVSSFPFKVQ